MYNQDISNEEDLLNTLVLIARRLQEINWRIVFD